MISEVVVGIVNTYGKHDPAEKGLKLTRDVANKLLHSLAHFGIVALITIIQPNKTHGAQICNARSAGPIKSLRQQTAFSPNANKSTGRNIDSSEVRKIEHGLFPCHHIPLVAFMGELGYKKFPVVHNSGLRACTTE